MLFAIGSDHAGYDLKNEIIKMLKELGHDYIDYGTNSIKSVDYPDFGKKVSITISRGKADRGILICGTVIGMTIVANKFKNVRASLCNELFTAKMSRLHNDANILVMGSKIVGIDLAKEIVTTWINTPFEGDRHCNRLRKISFIEKKFLKE